MTEEEQKQLIIPKLIAGFVREDEENLGANHIYGLSVSLIMLRSPCVDAEEVLLDLREALLSLPSQFTRRQEWGQDTIMKTDEWKNIRSLAQLALKKDGYRVSKPKKPLEIGEYPEHFREIL